MSNQDKWYLDHVDAKWDGFYSNEPLANISKPEQQELVLGGEVCMWGEHIDASDIEQTIWPRAAAAAGTISFKLRHFFCFSFFCLLMMSFLFCYNEERLWTSFDKLAKNPRDVTARLVRFRCLLNQRGVAAAPLAGFGRQVPEEPGSCFSQ